MNRFKFPHLNLFKIPPNLPSLRLKLPTINSNSIQIVVQNLNNFVNKVTEYDQILSKKLNLTRKESELLNSKQVYNKTKQSLDKLELELKQTIQDFQLQKQLQNITTMPLLYTRQLNLESEISLLKQELTQNWSKFELIQSEYFDLSRQLLSQENVYIYKTRRLSLTLNCLFIVTHLLIFILVQINERRKRQQILEEIKMVGDQLQHTSHELITRPQDVQQIIERVEINDNFYQGLLLGLIPIVFTTLFQIFKQ